MLSSVAIKTIWHSRHRTATVRELASSISLRFVESIGGTICGGFAAPRNCCQVASVICGSDSKLCIQRCKIVSSITTDERLLSIVTNARGMVCSSIELLIVDSILVLLSSTGREVTWMVTVG